VGAVQGRTIEQLSAILFAPAQRRQSIAQFADAKKSSETGVRFKTATVCSRTTSKREILELIEAWGAFAEPVEVVMKTRPLSSDPSDGMILDVAINGRAEALVTINKKHFVGAGKRFGIPVLSPVELLEKMREED